jgi:hypothetical protein
VEVFEGETRVVCRGLAGACGGFCGGWWRFIFRFLRTENIVDFWNNLVLLMERII